VLAVALLRLCAENDDLPPVSTKAHARGRKRAFSPQLTVHSEKETATFCVFSADSCGP
jgi:hypothetical protein